MENNQLARKFGPSVQLFRQFQELGKGAEGGQKILIHKTEVTRSKNMSPGWLLRGNGGAGMRMEHLAEGKIMNKKRTEINGEKIHPRMSSKNETGSAIYFIASQRIRLTCFQTNANWL